MHGLVIKKEPLLKILEGKKTWEMRGSRTRLRGRIALIEGGSGTIVGTASLSESKGPLTQAILKDNYLKHQAEPDTVDANFSYKDVHAWVLEDVQVFEVPLPYKHPSGAVIWVNLSEHESAISERKLKR